MPARRGGSLAWSESAAHIAQVVESFAAVGALGLAGWWFLEQRESYPRADLTQSSEVVHVEQGLIAVEVNVQVKNAGKKLLELHRARVRLQEVSAEPFDYSRLANLDGTPYWQSIRPIVTPDRRQFHDGELRWPVLKMFDGAIDYHIESGETDNMIFTFLVPCTRKVANKLHKLHTLRVATDIFKPEMEEGKEFAWKARAFVDVSKECEK